MHFWNWFSKGCYRFHFEFFLTWEKNREIQPQGNQRPKFVWSSLRSDSSKSLFQNLCNWPNSEPAVSSTRQKDVTGLDTGFMEHIFETLANTCCGQKLWEVTAFIFFSSDFSLCRVRIQFCFLEEKGKKKKKITRLTETFTGVNLQPTPPCAPPELISRKPVTRISATC